MDDKWKVEKIGTLKYDRLKAISVFYAELKSFYGYEYSLKQAKELFETLLSNKSNLECNIVLKHCIDNVFTDTKYIRLFEECLEHNFPENFIAPTG